MPNVQRFRFSFKSNPKAVKEYPVDTATAISIGDHVWLDTDDVKPANHALMRGNTAKEVRQKFARLFVGIAVSAHVADDAVVTRLRVAGRGWVEYPVGTATTFEIGNFVALTFTAGSPTGQLSNQQVERIVEPAEAIGRVTQRYGSNTSQVEYEFVGRAEAGGYPEQYWEAEYGELAAITNDTRPMTLIRRPVEVTEAWFTARTRGAAASSIKVDLQTQTGESLLTGAYVIDPGILAAAGDHVQLVLATTGFALQEGETVSIVTTGASGTQPDAWTVKMIGRHKLTP